MKNLDKIRDKMARQYEDSPIGAGVEAYKQGFSYASDLWSKECEKLVALLKMYEEYQCEGCGLTSTDCAICEALAAHNEFIGGNG